MPKKEFHEILGDLEVLKAQFKRGVASEEDWRRSISEFLKPYVETEIERLYGENKFSEVVAYGSFYLEIAKGLSGKDIELSSQTMSYIEDSREYADLMNKELDKELKQFNKITHS